MQCIRKRCGGEPGEAGIIGADAAPELRHGRTISLAAPVVRAQEEAVRIERNQREDLLPPPLSRLELSSSTLLSFLGSGPTVCLFERWRTVEKVRPASVPTAPSLTISYNCCQNGQDFLMLLVEAKAE